MKNSIAQSTTLLLGSNLGNRTEILKSAIKMLEEYVGKTTAVSSLYETLAWGIEDQPAFLNQVVILKTALSPEKLLVVINKIEKDLGRVRHKKWGERLIDIDILYYQDLIMKTDRLVIPHPEIANRKFTLVPLVELMPDFEHPLLKKTHSKLLISCKDELKVKRFL